MVAASNAASSHRHWASVGSLPLFAGVWAARREAAQEPAAERADAVEAAAAALSVAQVIDRILTLNPTATPEFLGQFPADRLERYYLRLAGAQEPRGRSSTWERIPETPAIIVHARLD